MASGVSITITGADQVISKLNKYGPAIQKVNEAELRKAADAVVKKAQSIAPVDTGYLRSVIDVDSVGPDETTITSNADYSAYQDADFMGEALDSEAGNFLRSLQSAVKAQWSKT